MIRSLLLCVLLAGALAAQPGAKTQFVGGTPPGIDPKATARLDLTGADDMVFRSKSGDVRVAFQRVNTLEYGQNVSRRYAAALLVSPILLLSKTRKHYITLGYTDVEGKQQVLVFQVDKRDIRTVLAGLQARTGRRVEYQDDDARKAGG
jgi:hypothetical protein